MKTPEYVKYIGEGEGGLKHGDIVKVLDAVEFGSIDGIYVQSLFQGNCTGAFATHRGNLAGHKFTYLHEKEYELIKEEEKVENNPKHKFKVGDIVRGNDRSNSIYDTTNDNMTKGEIIKVYNNDYFAVRILEHENKNYIGEVLGMFPSTALNPEYFNLIEDKPISDNLYHFTTDMRTFVNVEHNGNKGWSKCDIRCDEFDIHYGVDLAMERLDEVENPEKFGDAPKYVKITNKNYCSGGGVEFGDICKVLSTHKDSGYLYIKCPEKTNFGGDGANDKNALIGVNFTFVCREDYEPVDFNIYG